MSTLNVNSISPFSGSAVIVNGLEATGSIHGTASFSQQSATASFVPTTATASYVENAQTASYTVTAQTASYVKNAQTASYILPLNQNVIITGSVFLGSTDSVYFSGSAAASRLVWNDVDGTLDLGLKGGNSTLQIGQEQVTRVVNKTGANLLESQYKAIRIRSVAEGGAQGQRLAVVLAQADNDNNSVDTLGLVTENISVNQEGFITNSGLVRGINTTGALQGETWVDGDVLYLSPTIAGAITKVKPPAPQHTVIIGYVINANPSNGSIFVKVDNGYEIDELHNVKITTGSLAPGQLLVRSGSNSSGVWINTNKLTGSYQIDGALIMSGALQLNPTIDPGASNTTSSFFFVSKSIDNTEYNLHYRNNGALWETHWLEERAETGLIWGGVVTFSGTTIYVTPGAGLLIDHNANTGSHGDTIPTYVTFGPITASATYITSSQVTYLSIAPNGSLVQQTSIFTPQQYNEQLTLGYVFNLTTSSISSYADARVTTYGQDAQQSEFIRAFGPLKVSGFDLDPQPGSLRLGIGSGRSFRAGGFYSQNPDNPSIYDSSTIATGSLVRIYRDPAAVGGFRATLNGFVPYTTIDPTKYDDGTGTLASVASNEWTIQRLFQGAVNNVTYVYYGQNKYDSLAAAVQSIATEPFEESQTSIIALPFIGYVVAKGDTTNLADTTNNKVINSGLFRNTAGSSGGGGVATTILNDLSDVTITSGVTGQALVLNAGTWVNGTPLNSTSASYATTASFVTLAQTASFVALAQTASFVQNAQTASFILNAVSSSFASTASYAPNAIVTASVSSNTITFTKGNGATFPITVSTGSTAATLSYTAISSSATQTMSSTVFAVISGSSVTPVAGVWHVSSIVYGINATNSSTFEAAIFYGGVVVPNTTGTISQLANLRMSLPAQHVLVADGVTALDIRARVTTATLTNNMNSYYLTLIKIA